MEQEYRTSRGSGNSAAKDFFKVLMCTLMQIHKQHKWKLVKEHFR